MSDKKESVRKVTVQVEDFEMAFKGTEADERAEIIAGVITATGEAVVVAKKMNFEGTKAKGDSFVFQGMTGGLTLKGMRQQTYEQRAKSDEAKEKKEAKEKTEPKKKGSNKNLKESKK